jgi:hypothetical protein
MNERREIFMTDLRDRRDRKMMKSMQFIIFMQLTSEEEVMDSRLTKSDKVQS